MTHTNIEQLEMLEQKIEQTKEVIFFKTERLEKVSASLSDRNIHISLLVIGIMGVLTLLTSSVFLLVATIIVLISCVAFFILDTRDKYDEVFELDYHIAVLYKDLENYNNKQDRLYRSSSTPTTAARYGQVRQSSYLDDQLFWLLLLSSHCEFDTSMPPSNPIVNMDVAIERSLDDNIFRSLDDYTETSSSDSTSSSFDNSYSSDSYSSDSYSSSYSSDSYSSSYSSDSGSSSSSSFD